MLTESGDVVTYLEQQAALDDVVELVVMAADTVAMDARRAGKTNAQITREVIRAALDCGLGNGLIEITPPEQWPPTIGTNPPYLPITP